MSVELAYAAGLFDGEGCVLWYLYPSRGTYRVCYGVNPTNCDSRALKFMHDQFGGSVRTTSKRINRGQRNEIGLWELRGQNAVAFAKAIAPYSILKRDQLELFIEAAGSCFSNGERGRRVGGGLTDADLKKRERYAKRMKKFKRPVYEGVV